MVLLAALLAGLVFGFGLLLSGIANPDKALAFLDLADAWDPSLLLVMLGAIGVGLIAFTLARRRATSLLGLEMKLPAARQIARRRGRLRMAGTPSARALTRAARKRRPAGCRPRGSVVALPQCRTQRLLRWAARHGGRGSLFG